LFNNVENRRLAALARYFCAMALHWDGRSPEAEVELQSANELLRRLVLPGHLNLRFPANESWTTLASCLLAREQAENLILGQRISAPVTSETLAEARERWKPVHELLAEVDEAARRQDYREARESYARARAHPGFDLEAAFQDYPWMIEKLPVILALAEDQEGLEGFLHEVYEGAGQLPPNYFVPVAYAHSGLADDLQQRIESTTTAAAESALQVPAVLEPHHYWELRHAGVGLYGLGRHEDALGLLRQAFASPNHDCSVSAKAYAALAAWELGRIDEAKQWIRDAAEALRVQVQAGEGMLAPAWWHFAATDLALREARKQMGENEWRTIQALDE
jgi:tetratricopeptide (TPR) repeat protein